MTAPDPVRHLLDAKLTVLRDAVDQLEQVLAMLRAARRSHVAPAVEARLLAFEEIERRIYRPRGR
jgi:hypothetical protein